MEGGDGRRRRRSLDLHGGRGWGECKQLGMAASSIVWCAGVVRLGFAASWMAQAGLISGQQARMQQVRGPQQHAATAASELGRVACLLPA